MSFSSIGLQSAQLTALRVAVGADRLAAYDTAVGGERARAIDFYGWNAAVSAALFEDFSVLEVVLRNACHRELRIWNAAQGNSSPWYHHPVLTPPTQDALTPTDTLMAPYGPSPVPHVNTHGIIKDPDAHGWPSHGWLGFRRKRKSRD